MFSQPQDRWHLLELNRALASTPRFGAAYRDRQSRATPPNPTPRSRHALAEISPLTPPTRPR